MILRIIQYPIKLVDLLNRHYHDIYNLSQWSHRAIVFYSMREQKCESKQYEYLAKVIIIGDSSVGKSSLLQRFTTNTFNSIHTPTIGLDFKSTIIALEGLNTRKKTRLDEIMQKNKKERIKLQLWDTAGQERFRTVTQTYYKGISGVAIVYAVDDKSSFGAVTDWLEELENNHNGEVPIIIIGNKCDLMDSRQVSFQEGRLLADSKKAMFVEASAKQGINVEQAFHRLAEEIGVRLKNEVKSVKSSVKLKNTQNQQNISQKDNKQRRKECCK